jgi:hypothetical protein
MLLIQTAGTSWDLRMLLREPAFRIVIFILVGFFGSGMVLYFRRQSRRYKSTGSSHGDR